MQIVLSFGYAYKLTNNNYKKLLKDIVLDKDIDLSKYGTPLGNTVNITDMTSREAQELLEDLQQ
jgi:hypothetical protein